MITLDYIRDIHIYQHKHGYRFSVDALLLASFVSMIRVRRIADFCAGTGVVGLLLARKYPASEVTLVELQKSLVELARKNADLNNIGGRVQVVHADLKDLATAHGRRTGSAWIINSMLAETEQHNNYNMSGAKVTNARLKPVAQKLSILFPSESCDLVVANPPFRTLRTGKVSSGDERALARHELALPLKELVAAAAYVLHHHGRFCFIHLPERITELVCLLRTKNLEIKRMRFVHSQLKSRAKMVLIEAIKNAKTGMTVESPLCLYDECGNYTNEVTQLYQAHS
jgi:tRNA1Val (adenine37-N6)-methyltransferase